MHQKSGEEMKETSLKTLTSCSILNKCILAKVDEFTLVNELLNANITDEQLSDHDRQLLWSYYDMQITIYRISSDYLNDYIDRLIAQRLFIRELIEAGPTRVIKKLSKNNLIPKEYSKSKNDEVRFAAVRQFNNLEAFVNDPCERIRVFVAKSGTRLDLLIHDKSKKVRAHVAQQGYGACVLKNDSHAKVRKEARKHTL